MFPRKLEKGFTLIEVMIVVVILSLLAAVAVPSYLDSVRKGRRNNAKLTLQENVNFMDAFMTINTKYDVDKGGTAVALPAATSVSPIGATGGNIDYNISFSIPPTSTTYTIRAVPVNKMAGDACGTFTINNAGARTVSGSLSMADCWYK
ncbi:MAG: type IV pilin protein [Undibacterium umbellatum]|uniref:type IV pilin protein n=1 Tax=Undibacterium umbellatum TaxID=2762300 RepID=UPI003BB5DE14